MSRALAGYRLDEHAAVGPDGERVHLARRRPGPAVDDEVAALIEGAGDHVPVLVDVASAPNGDVVLVLEHLPHRLADLLLVPGWPTPGEAVTVLVPIARAVASLAAARVRHGAVAPGAIRFDDRGRPVLARFGQAAPMTPLDDGAADERALRLLAETLLERCGADEAARRIAVDRPAPAALAELLFDVADPMPVRLRPEPVVGGGPPARLVAVPAVPAAPATQPRTEALLGRFRTGVARLLSVPHLSLPHLSTVRLRTVRVRVWAAAGASAALLVAALVLLPSHADRSAAIPAAASAAAPSAAAHAPATAPTSASPAPDDPVAAVAALLDERAACLTASRPACLRGVDAADSPLAADDLTALRAGADAAPTPAGTPHLVRRAGGTALVTVGGTTVLAVRQPDGWRLRDLVAA